ncbi:hypothetical protein H0H87_002872 [Tephrocybe sp. NHM501043]|nr:hypothetical protein H0H87_002872 [Tephrocybe sp. NHM501043]
MVVIKGVQTFQNNTSVEYSDLDIMQMLGRADGIALIMCEVELEQKYRALVQGKTILESTLHTNLAEHLNSEIGLGTITSISTAKEWLRGSFLFQRLRKNPNHYSVGKDDNQTWEERVDDLVMQSVDKLRQTQLIEIFPGTEGDKLASTDFGDIMSKLYIRQSTMALILAIPDRPTLRDMTLNKMRRHPDIRFEMKKLERTADKVFLLIQAVLGGISLNSAEYKSADSQPQLEAFAIFRHVSRIAKAIVEVGVFKQLGAQVKYGLELLRCLTAKAWEDRPVVLRQLEQIGEKSTKSLKEAKTFVVTVELTRPSQGVTVFITSETIAGLVVSQSYKPTVSPKEFPTRNTRPPTAIDIDLEGLEDDPDFWNMDVGEEIMPVVRDLTRSKGQATDDVETLSTSHIGQSGTLLQNLDRETASPKKLPNGNYECNHPCKEKDKCRHLCCRDGLPAKPKKRTSFASPALQSPRRLQVQEASGVIKPKTASTRKTVDWRLEQLEYLHERTNVSSNLQLSTRHRLKLDSPSALKRKQKPIPDFKIEYTDLKDSLATEKSSYDSVELDDSDDNDLPEASGISLGNKTRAPPSDNDYCNSDIDSLILTVPLDDEAPASGKPSCAMVSFASSPFGGHKRKGATMEPVTAKKRVRTGLKEWKSSQTSSRGNVAQHSESVKASTDLREDLFLPDFGDELEANAYDDHELSDVHPEPGFLDDDNLSTLESFDIETAAPALTISTIISDSFDQSGLPLPIGRNSPPTITPNKKEDDFAELDMWLNSGAVEIL